MDDFERQLSASMKNAVEHPVDSDVPPAHRWIKAGGVAAVLVASAIVSVFVVTGGSSENKGHSTDPVADPQPLTCPHRLPQETEGNHGFGPEQAATEAPDLPEPESAVVCEYVITRHVPSPGHRGFWWWALAKSTSPEWRVSSDQLSVLGSDLSQLGRPQRGTGITVCADNLGPRYLLLYGSGGRTIGVVVDAFGCDAARLTSDPGRIVAGTDSTLGTGAFQGSYTLADHLRRFTDPRR